jgi:hypothetical protein
MFLAYTRNNNCTNVGKIKEMLQGIAVIYFNARYEMENKFPGVVKPNVLTFKCKSAVELGLEW